MAISTFERLLEEASHLTPEERRRLASALSEVDGKPTGATLVERLGALEPLDAAAWDEMERVIEEGCEQIDSRDW